MTSVETGLRAEIEVLRATLLAAERARDACRAELSASLAVMHTISRSRGALDVALEAVASTAARLCHAHGGRILLWDGEAMVDGPTSDPDARGFRSAGSRSPLPAETLAKLREGRVLHYPDLWRDAAAAGMTDAQQQYIRDTDQRSVLSLPLIGAGDLLGMMVLVRLRQARPFSDTELALAQGFADQAVIALENAHLLTELEHGNRDLAESLGQQTAMAEILTIISRSPADLDPVLFEIVDRAGTMLEGDVARLLISDGPDSSRSFICGPFDFDLLARTPGLRDLEHVSATRARWRGDGLPAMRTRNLAGYEVLSTGQALQVSRGEPNLGARYSDSPRLGGMIPAVRVSVPVRQQDTIIGMLTVDRTRPVLYTEQQIGLLQAFADQAVIAIQNARLLNELELRNTELAESLKQQTAVAEVLQTISRSVFDLQAVLDALAQNAAQLLASPVGAIYRLHGDAPFLAALFESDPSGAISRVAPATYAEWERRGTPMENVQAMVERKRPLRYFMGPGTSLYNRASAEVQRYFDAIGPLSTLEVPLLRGDAALGAMSVATYGRHEYSDRDTAVLQTFADQAVIAIENSRLIEEIREKSHQLEEANAAKSHFLSAMSHELRTPLNAVIGYSELLREEAQDEGLEGMVPDLVRINAAGKHLLSLINNVLDISKIEAGRMELEVQDFAVSDALAEVEAVVPPLMSKNGNRFQLNAGDDLGRMHSDETKLRQCLLNLLSNAAKFTEHGTVTLAVGRRVAEASDELRFTISDTGIGMTEEQLGRLFQSFTQAEAGTASRYGGTGLGLSLSRELARLMGGDITAESEPGNGSNFTLTVPSFAPKTGIRADGMESPSS